MARFALYEAAPPHRRIVKFESDVDPKDEQACVALLRVIANQHKRRPAEVMLRAFGRRIREYRG